MNAFRTPAPSAGVCLAFWLAAAGGARGFGGPAAQAPDPPRASANVGGEASACGEPARGAHRAAPGETRLSLDPGGLASRIVLLGRARLSREGGGAAARLVLAGERRSGLATRERAVPLDGPRLLAVRLLLARRGGADPLPVRIELEDDAGGRWWRLVRLAGHGAHAFTIEAGAMRHARRRVARRERLARVRVVLPEGGALVLESLAVRHGARDPARELAALAFPGGGGRLRREGGALVATDAADLDLEALAAHASRVIAYLQAFVPAAAELERERSDPVPLVVFRDEEHYRAFPPRLAAARGAKARAPVSDGVTLEGVAVGWLAPQGPKIRPSFTHELAHAWAARALGLPHRGDWLQEGLAARAQLAFHPERALAQPLGALAAWPPRRWLALAAGRRIAPAERLAAAVLVEALAGESELAARFPSLLEGLLSADSSALAPHLGPVLGLDEGQLAARAALAAGRLARAARERRMPGGRAGRR